MIPTAIGADSALTPFCRSPRARVKRTESGQHLRLVKGCCSSDVHATALRDNVEMELDPDNLFSGNHNGDWLREKALHIDLD